MRQTSQAAVALLMTTASASVNNIAPIDIDHAIGYQGTPTVFNAKGIVGTDPQVATEASQMSSRTAPYQNYKILPHNYTWAGNSSPVTLKVQGGYVLKNVAYADATSKLGDPCMRCINFGGVWCSRTFNYWLTASSPYQYASGGTKTLGLDSNIADSVEKMWKGGFDGGSCCNTAIEFVKLVGYVGTVKSMPSYAAAADGSESAATLGAPNVARACVANLNAKTDGGAGGTTTKFGQTSWNNVATAYTSWWCSNGLYKKVTGTATNAGVLNTTQTFQSGTNQRKELAQVGCPQKSALCGTGNGAGVTGVYTMTKVKKTVTVAKGSGLGFTDKCTWTAMGYEFAPTFTVNVGADKLGITSTNWQLHVMEYATSIETFKGNYGMLSAKFSSTDGMIDLTEGVSRGNYAPRFDMQGEQFNTLRTWYGMAKGVGQNVDNSKTTQYGEQYSSWFAPGNSGFALATSNLIAAQGTQYYGNVAAIGTSKMQPTSTKADYALTATDGNYGVLNSAKFDFRSVRYVPFSVVNSVYTTGSDLAKAYNAEVASYNTAKTTWNNYVAILTKNAKMDAFAAAFSPPKAPTVPPLPNLPWTPTAYTGFQKQTTLQAANFAYNQAGTKFSSTAQPASNQFWLSLDAAQSIGGWGSWTAQIMTYRATWGKSFGTIGFNTKTDMSFVWNNDWMCVTGVTQSDTSACAQNKVTNGGSTDVPAQVIAKTDTFNIAATTTAANFVTLVSLWSLGNYNSDGGTNTAMPWTKSDLVIDFIGADWSTTVPALTAAISYSTKPTAADTLSGIAGAQALAASSAAVLALAALY